MNSTLMTSQASRQPTAIDTISADLAEEVLAIGSELATALFNAEPQSPVLKRWRALRDRVQQAEPAEVCDGK